MNLIEIKCEKCGASLNVNAELPKCMCQYCGAEIVLSQLEAQTAAANPEQPADDPNEVAKYKKMLKMNIIIGLVAFILRFFVKYSMFLTFAGVIFLCLLPLRDANKCLKAKELLIRNGAQKGNIIGLAVLILVDIALWVLLLLWQLKMLIR